MNLALIILLLIGAGSSGINERLADVAERGFVQAYGSVAPHVEIDVVRVTGIDADAASIDIDWPSDRPQGTTQLRVRDSVSGIEGWALLRIRLMDHVAVPTRQLEAGDVLDAGTVRFELTDLGSVNGRALTRSNFDHLSAEAPLEARRRLRADRALRMDDVRGPLAAEPGHTIMITYTRGPLVMTLSGTARESGSVGDIIRIYSSDTRATYRARLTGDGQAEWIETK